MCLRSRTSTLLIGAPHNHHKSIFISPSSSNNSMAEAQAGLSWHLAVPKLASSCPVSGRSSCRPSVSTDHTSRAWF